MLCSTQRAVKRYLAQPGFACGSFPCFLPPRFFKLSEECRRGAHLCFTPSCSEPFGYVDVEFGLLGVPESDLAKLNFGV